MKLNKDLIEDGVDDPLSDDLDMGDDFLNDDLSDDYFGEGGQAPLDKHQDLLKELTNFDSFLKDKFNNWLGLMWSEKEDKYVKNPLIKPIMNMKGAAWCLGFLTTYTRGNNIITDIRSEEFAHIMEDVICAIWYNLGTRSDLGVNEVGDLIRVANELEHATALVLMGAGDGKYNRMLGTTYSVNSTVNQNEPRLNPMGVQGKTGMIEKLKNRILSM